MYLVDLIPSVVSAIRLLLLVSTDYIDHNSKNRKTEDQESQLIDRLKLTVVSNRQVIPCHKKEIPEVLDHGDLLCL